MFVTIITIVSKPCSGQEDSFAKFESMPDFTFVQHILDEFTAVKERIARIGVLARGADLDGALDDYDKVKIHVWPVLGEIICEREECAMKRKASAIWKGGLKDGKGTISTDSGVLSDTQYSFSTRFEDGIGTNPEELIAAAHAGCFSMALSAQLGNAGMTAESIETTATVTLEKLDAGFTITEVHLDLVANIPGADPAAFETAAKNAKEGCPISRLLNAKISLTSKLENAAASHA